jgi:putative Mn2+ efflux pump MntP
MHLFESILLIFIGLVFVVASLADKRHVDNADEEPIEAWGLFRKGVYVTHERAYQGVVIGLVGGIIFILIGIILLFV